MKKVESDEYVFLNKKDKLHIQYIKGVYYLNIRLDNLSIIGDVAKHFNSLLELLWYVDNCTDVRSWKKFNYHEDLNNREELLNFEKDTKNERSKYYKDIKTAKSGAYTISIFNNQNGTFTVDKYRNNWRETVITFKSMEEVKRYVNVFAKEIKGFD